MRSNFCFWPGIGKRNRTRVVSCLSTLLLFLLLRVAPAAQSHPPLGLPDNIDFLVQRAMKTFDVPGVSLAIVKGGRKVLVKGYGIRQLGTTEAVDARTLFGIASNTKVFTAAALGMMVEEGKLVWDAPVIDYLPDFQMWDPYVTRELTVRDLLVHRSGLGLGAGDLLWWPATDYSRRDVLRRLRFLRPATSFRSSYAYDNVLYIVAGEVLEAASLQTWEDFITRRILEKIGMRSSRVRHSDLGTAGNIAAPHAPLEGAVRVIPPFLGDITNAAGGISSCAEDMSQWMMVLLKRGMLADGSRLFSERTAGEITAVVTPIPELSPPPELFDARSHFYGYALGLHVRTYRGEKACMHSGVLPGYVSQVWLLPEKELGIAILTNQESAEAYQALTYQLTDYYLQATGVDWIEALQKVRKRKNAETESVLQRQGSARDESSRPSLPLEKYRGRYTDSWYGDVEIAQERDHLVLRFSHTPGLRGDLQHWQQDTFLVRWRDRSLRADAYLTFALTPEGKIDQAKMQAVSPDTDFSYNFHDLLLKPAR